MVGVRCLQLVRRGGRELALADYRDRGQALAGVGASARLLIRQRDRLPLGRVMMEAIALVDHAIDGSGLLLALEGSLRQ
jgi:hypothetical protein